jgi:hypothetical protein
VGRSESVPYPLDQRIEGDVEAAHGTDLDVPVPAERPHSLQTEVGGQHGVVAHLRMAVQGDVGRIEGDVVRDEGPDLPAEAPGDGRRPFQKRPWCTTMKSAPLAAAAAIAASQASTAHRIRLSFPEFST